VGIFAQTRAVRRVLVFVLLVACQSGATTGTPCQRSSECASPLVCRLGRCRTECTSDRDCTPGARCYFAAGGGVCELPMLDVCALEGVCEAPLVCRANRCAQVCSSSIQCGGGACSGAVCMPASPDAGVGDGGVALRATCQSDVDCAANEACTADAVGIGALYCRRTCTSDAECASAVGPGSVCALFNGTTTTGQYVCTEACSILSPSCAPGDACGPLILETITMAYPTVPECRFAGAGAIGSACATDQWRCPANAVCDGDATCHSLCPMPVTSDGGCPAGTTCQTYAGGAPLFSDGIEIGVCR